MTISISRSTRNALRVTVLGVLLAGFATLGIAQQPSRATDHLVTTTGTTQTLPSDQIIAAQVVALP